MMKKTVIAMAILGSAAFISTAQAKDGTVNFTGVVTDSTCTVSPATATQTVALGTVSSGNFTTAGFTASPTKFGITLSACPAAATSAGVKFDGPTDSANSDLLKLTAGTGVAEGVAIGIYEDDATTLIPMTTKSVSKTLSTTAPTTLNFVAKYVATSSTVVAGTANAASDFTISYN